MQRFAGALLVAGLVVGAAGAASAGDGDLLWSTQATGDADTYRGCWTAAAGKGLVFVGGQHETSSDRGSFSVWAFRQRDGTLAWEHHYDREGDGSDWVNALALKGKRLVAVGRTTTAAGGTAWTVRTLDARNGNLLWDDNVDVEGSLRDEAQGVAIRGGTVYVVGQTRTTAGGEAFTVRAVKLRDGSLLWEDAYDHEDDFHDVAGNVTVLGRRVAVTGTVITATGGSAAAVRTYDGRKGVLLWQDYRDVEGDGLDSYSGGVVAARGTVFAAGSSHTTAGETAMTVRAFKVKDGRLLWEDLHDREGALQDSAWTLAARGKLVVLGGRTTTAEGTAFSVRALGAKDGTVLWEHHRTRPSDAPGFDRTGVHTVSIGRGRVYATGVTDAAVGGMGFQIVALAARSGDVSWEDRIDDAPAGNDEFPWTALHAGRRLFVTGELNATGGDYVVPVIAYKAR